MSSPQDDIFSEPLPDVPKFTFDSQVVSVFPDMIKRSVPGYGTILHMIGQIAQRYVQDNTHCYDLGCSLGGSLLAMRQNISQQNVHIVGIDNSAAMVESCTQVINADTSPAPVSLVCGDITEIQLEPSSLCVLNFTLQFVAPEQRATLLKKIAASLVPGGVLVLSEKLAFNDNEHEQLMIDLHHDFKRQNGYSDLEIAQKREAIDDVLIPETFEAHRQRLLDSGFRSADLWFQCFNFSSIIAFR